ncbi:selenide, water dikinase SelD [uncultured Thiothrix sp.]|uniref:selenide, water dikinase SelD n=1 Tax=uncultured Thiothrix sp. TaxID=223185 RepID=UPI0026046C3B|nr:selenide, water dikinase SelD [uncultured Thiothrix sp.]
MYPVRLTEYSHGAGCGCKISPAVLDVILESQLPADVYPALLVGNSSRDDAAVYDLGNGTAVISTTDFFMPIVDDPFTFGRIAATNAISDIYAMGGKPLMAIAIFGWPIDKLPPEVGQQVIEGGRKACQDAGIPLAGGHSIDAPEPIFGLAVTGIVQTKHLKQNSTARAGDKLYLTKPLGIGILTTAQKRKILKPEHSQLAIDTMCVLNELGTKLGELEYVHALTDVTGFGLGGHLREICEGSRLQAVLAFSQIPLMPAIHEYLDQDCTPGGTQRNFASYGHIFADELTLRQQHILCDPQTSGGLLIAVDPEHELEFLAVTAQAGFNLKPIGFLQEPLQGQALIKVLA